MKLCRFFSLSFSVVLLFGFFQASVLGQQPVPREPYRWQNVKIVAGGFITGIIPHPTMPGVTYVRTDIGGAYRYDPFTKKFTSLTDVFNANDWNLMGTESIAVDTVDAGRVYL